MDDTPQLPSRPMSEDQFLAWAETQEGRFELIEGRVVMHTGATRDHERIAKRVFIALHARCDAEIHDVNAEIHDVNKGDFGVRIRPGRDRGSILYPDVVVDLQSGDGKERATTTPVIVVEVLSASTGYAEHLDKFEAYKIRDSLRQYVVLEQDVPKAYVWLKDEAGWPQEPMVLEGPGTLLAFPPVGAEIGLFEIYGKGGGTA